ncbi:DUF4395 domain-containing protein [Kitasatospora cheerisanensis]|uniref:DUF4395 domain-containing protein n=1 Tax=Kitasatospora cheerisanensis KCTC 2395 TaxID=1348663 RepID=A0A066Z2N4_9ACTN|nr:DUF4395 domain-containing protein [Kitasatospora cheerisanensis]KDN86509.1 hypothetical protein KCH_17370 [Kitasatospora cheerisanensis KCTC 2395]
MQIDPRGPRFAAVLTSAVLAASLITDSGVLLAVQALVFALGAAGRSPYSLLFRAVVRPRLAPPAELEDARPPRFAQCVGLAFALFGLLGHLTGTAWLALAATGLALAAAFLNAAFDYCLGCEFYLLLHRARPRPGT